VWGYVDFRGATDLDFEVVGEHVDAGYVFIELSGPPRCPQI
jgi:hypothetical protein